MKPSLVSLIFKSSNEQQPWILNLELLQHEIFCSLIVKNLTSLGVENKKRKVKNQINKKIAEFEVTKESTTMTDIGLMLDNMGIYEQALMESDPSCGGTGFELTTVQTLLTLYQKIIEYYSAVDNKLYIDIK